MILVTVGTVPQSFNRLLKTVDELVNKGKIKEKVIMQIGNSTYEPKNVRWFRFTSNKEIDNLNRNARIVITHGGAGNILTALNYGKIIIAIPRLKKFNEHTDNHQLDLVRTLEKHGKIIAVYDIKDLEKAVSKNKNYSIFKKTKSRLSKEIENYLQAL